ncbi:MAG: ornithine cyclodeaminase family protein [Acidobacteriota bacterium]
MLILTETDLRSVLKMREVIDAVELGFRALARGDAFAPARLAMDLPGRDAVLLAMPAYLGLGARASRPHQGAGKSIEQGNEQAALGTKFVGVFPRNPERSLDVVQGVYLLLDAETGVALSLMDGRFITAMRTAATSAVATKLMTSPGPKQLAVFGAGVQAQFHIDAMIEVADIGRVMIVSRGIDQAQALAEQVRALHNLPCDVVTGEEAAAQGDLICTCTSSPLPLFDGSVIKPGTHINAVGAFTPETRELDTETVRRSRVIIDAESAAGSEAGEILIPLAEGAIEASHVKGTLAEVVSGKVAGRESAEQITLFKSCGLAIEDLVTARLAYAKAIAENVGTQVRL